MECLSKALLEEQKHIGLLLNTSYRSHSCREFCFVQSVVVLMCNSNNTFHNMFLKLWFITPTVTVYL